MFRRLWDGIKDFVSNNAGMLIGGAIGGPLGGLIGYIVDEFIFNRPQFEDVPEHLQPELYNWSDNVLQPIIEQTIIDIGQATAEQLVSPNYVNKFNAGLKKLATLKAYYEFQMTTATRGEETLINEIKIETIGKSIVVLTDAYYLATEGITTSYSYQKTAFTPSETRSVGSKSLDWKGAKVEGSYYSFKTASSGQTTAPPIRTPQPTNPVVVPGPSPSPTVKPPTTTTAPVTTAPATTIRVDGDAPQPANKNKKYWIAGAALAIAALIYSQN